MQPESLALNDAVLENAYYRMLDAAPDALVIADAQGTIRLVNAQAERLFGYAREELLGSKVELLLPDHLRAGHVSHRNGYAAAPKVRAMGSGLELFGRRKDGSEFPLEVSLSPLKTEAGLFVLSALRDISERKRAEMGNLLLAAIVDSSEDAIVSTTHDGTISSWNSGATRMFGYSADEAIGRNFSMLAPEPSARIDQAAHYARLARGEIIEPYEALRTRKDGSTVHVSIRVSPIRDARGQLLGTSATARDIGEHRVAEQQARLLGQRLLSAVESIQGMFALFDTDDRIVLCNSSFRSFFGAAVPGAIVGRSFAELVEGSLRCGLFDLADQDREVFRENWLRHHQNPGQPFELLTRAGRTLRISDRATAEGGKVKTIWDVSADVRAADELRKAHLLTEKASTAKSEFLASMSHELRTPLNAVLGFAQLLQRDKKTPLTEKQREKVDHVLRGGEHLLRLIDDVLDLTRIEAGRVPISLEPVLVAEVLTEVQRTLEPMAARPETVLRSESLPATDLRVFADRVRFAQVLMNYGSNAIKYGRKHGLVRFVVTRSRQGFVRIGVIDDGEGIPADKQRRLFEPFQRAGQELGPIEGTGIGLTICKRLAANMGGQVGFRSELSVGSEFWIELPEYQETQAYNQLPTVTLSSTSRTVQRGERRVVVYIEDNPSNIAFMREVMEELGYVQLITAPTAEIGLEIVRTHLPDVVLMDINLPGMNGIEASHRLREWPETRAIPVVALTAAAMTRERQRDEVAVFDHYLTKPLSVDELTTTLENLFAGRSHVSRTKP
jgi:PAS domain S-box-containing protein